MLKCKILVVDDNQVFCQSVTKYLTLKEHAECEYALSKDEALDKIKAKNFDLITLDIEMGPDNGIELLAIIREYYQGPIIFLSCISDIKVRVKSLKQGGDDYLMKPFAMEELVVRAEKLIQRYEPTHIERYGDYVLDILNKKAKYKDMELELYENAFNVLRLLLNNENKVLSREYIYSQIWNSSYKYSSRVIDIAIVQIRQQTVDSHIKSVRGVGYVYEC